MIDDIKLQQIRQERDLIVRSAVIVAITRMRVYAEYFDTWSWSESEEDEYPEAAQEITKALFDALHQGRTEEAAVQQRIEAALREEHPDGVMGMEEALALAWRVQRIVAEFRIGEPKERAEPAIAY